MKTLYADGPDHAHIEEEEDARQRIFEGLPEQADLEKDYETPHDPLEHHEHLPGQGPDALNGTDEVVNDGEQLQAVMEGGDAEEATSSEGRAVMPERQARRNAPARQKEPTESSAKQPRHRHTHEERARADMPYSEWRSVEMTHPSFDQAADTIHRVQVGFQFRMALTEQDAPGPACGRVLSKIIEGRRGRGRECDRASQPARSGADPEAGTRVAARLASSWATSTNNINTAGRTRTGAGDMRRLGW